MKLILNKLLLTTFFAASVIFFSCCAKGDYPKIPYTPKTYLGDNNLQALCRLVKKDEVKHQGLCFFYTVYDNEYDLECIRTDCIKVTDYICIKDTDYGMIQNYIADLISSCKSWR